VARARGPRGPPPLTTRIASHTTRPRCRVIDAHCDRVHTRAHHRFHLASSTASLLPRRFSTLWLAFSDEKTPSTSRNRKPTTKCRHSASGRRLAKIKGSIALGSPIHIQNSSSEIVPIADFLATFVGHVARPATQPIACWGALDPRWSAVLA